MMSKSARATDLCAPCAAVIGQIRRADHREPIERL
jgi:hypothetical protein